MVRGGVDHEEGGALDAEFVVLEEAEEPRHERGELGQAGAAGGGLAGRQGRHGVPQGAGDGPPGVAVGVAGERGEGREDHARLHGQKRPEALGDHVADALLVGRGVRQQRGGHARGVGGEVEPDRGGVGGDGLLEGGQEQVLVPGRVAGERREDVRQVGVHVADGHAAEGERRGRLGLFRRPLELKRGEDERLQLRHRAQVALLPELADRAQRQLLAAAAAGGAVGRGAGRLQARDEVVQGGAALLVGGRGQQRGDGPGHVVHALPRDAVDDERRQRRQQVLEAQGGRLFLFFGWRGG